MKKNKIMRLASVLLVAVILSTCAISGTFAKYTSTTTGSDTARVAKWSFTLNGDTLANEFTFNLFETIKDSDGGTEEDVAKATEGNTTIIAPGTSGEFEIVLKNVSEVDAQYTITYTVNNGKSIPVKFSVDDGTNWSDNLANVSATPIDMNGEAKIKIQWKWAFDAEGNNDNSFAAGTAEIEVKAAITVEQVD